MAKSFSFAPTPQLYFGTGKISMLPALAQSFGTKILLITGARSFLSSGAGQNLMTGFQTASLEVRHFIVDREPSPQMVDTATVAFSTFSPDVVVAIGGGSVLDAGKAISAMLPLNQPVKNYLEGVGTKSEHPGTKVPYVAVPTTAGTGSEATKNAVLSEVGETGYKKSLRHSNFVPDIAVVDPSISLSCSKATTAASGMDAFTQLLESYLSPLANPITDALAYEGLERISIALPKVYRDGANLTARTDMALAAYLSGITLANAGLGVVHGFASAIGGLYPIPHGVICSALMAACNKIIVRKLRSREDAGNALIKYARIGRVFSHMQGKSEAYYIDSLLALIEKWTEELEIPKLTHCGVLPTDFERIGQCTDNKSNPVALDRDELVEVLFTAG